MATTVEAIDFTDFALKMKLAIWTDKTSECWGWQGTKVDGGYGRFKYRGEVYLAHRAAWAIANQADPGKLMVDHMCHNTGCVNPSHLRLVTNKQNLEHILPVRAASGFRGVHRHGKKWRASVWHNGVPYRSACFDTPEEANEAAIGIRNSLFTHNLLDRQAV